tara:strand:+ start:325 stop:867 length:543 start_codon:yes stop_codon:yes gene_type:complete
MNDFDEKREEESNSVTLEDLIRLKRHERPLDEFWDDFEVEFKERTLRSVVRKKTWFSVFQSCLVNPWTFCVSGSVAALAFLLYFPFDKKTSDLQLSPAVVSTTATVSDFLASNPNIMETSSEVEFIDGALVLNDPGQAEFDTAFSSNDLRAISMDSTTYVEENLTTLIEASKPDDHRAIF